MAFFIARQQASRDHELAMRHTTIDNTPYETQPEAESAARERYPLEPCQILEAGSPHEALRRMLPNMQR